MGYHQSINVIISFLRENLFFCPKSNTFDKIAFAKEKIAMEICS